MQKRKILLIVCSALLILIGGSTLFYYNQLYIADCGPEYNARFQKAIDANDTSICTDGIPENINYSEYNDFAGNITRACRTTGDAIVTLGGKSSGVKGDFPNSELRYRNRCFNLFADLTKNVDTCENVIPEEHRNDLVYRNGFEYFMCVLSVSVSTNDRSVCDVLNFGTPESISTTNDCYRNFDSRVKEKLKTR